MKKSFLFISIVIAFSHIALCQDTQTGFLKKSKKQKTAAWILVGGGIAIIVTGSIFVALSNAVDLYDDSDLHDFGIVLIATGSVIGVFSIPLFIASSKNKTQALLLSLKNEPTPWIQNNNMVRKNVYSITMKIGF